MSPVLALLPSPLLGPAAWRPALAALAGRGLAAISTGPVPAGSRTPGDVARWLLDALPPGRELILVPHSQAGLYVPALAARRRVVAQVFVDAAVPPERGAAPLVPPALLEVLGTMAGGDGMLPPWTRWWDETEVAGLLPDRATRELVEGEQRRLPLSYFEASVPVPAGWDAVPGAYLAFGEAYDADRREAARRGWPTATLPGGHLHMAADPEAVAAEIHALLETAGVAPG